MEIVGTILSWIAAVAVVVIVGPALLYLAVALSWGALVGVARAVLWIHERHARRFLAWAGDRLPLSQ